jgi:hypothetical protein
LYSNTQHAKRCKGRKHGGCIFAKSDMVCRASEAARPGGTAAAQGGERRGGVILRMVYGSGGPGGEEGREVGGRPIMGARLVTRGGAACGLPMM